MVPFSAFASGYWTFGSPKLERYNGLPAVQTLGQAAPGFSSGDAMATVDRLAQQLPPGVGLEFTGLSYEERLAGSQSSFTLVLSLVWVFSTEERRVGTAWVSKCMYLWSPPH